MSEPKKLAYSQGKFDPNHPLVTQSFLKTWVDCAYAAKRSYIDGDKIPPGVAALQGNAVDAAVTLGADSVMARGSDVPLKDKVDLALTVFHETQGDYRLFPEDDINALGEQTKGLVERHHVDIAHTLKPIATQESILVKGEHFDIAGTIDLVEKTGDEVTLGDTKTAGKSGEYPAKGFFQAALYTNLYEAKHGIRPSGFRFDVVVKTKTPKTERPAMTVTPVESNILKHVISSTISELKHSLDSGVFRLAAPGHWRCMSSGKWCGYLYNGCPKGEKQ